MLHCAEQYKWTTHTHTHTHAHTCIINIWRKNKTYKSLKHNIIGNVVFVFGGRGFHIHTSRQICFPLRKIHFLLWFLLLLKKQKNKNGERYHMHNQGKEADQNTWWRGGRICKIIEVVSPFASSHVFGAQFGQTLLMVLVSLVRLKNSMDPHGPCLTGEVEEQCGPSWSLSHWRGWRTVWTMVPVSLERLKNSVDPKVPVPLERLKNSVDPKVPVSLERLKNSVDHGPCPTGEVEEQCGP